MEVNIGLIMIRFLSHAKKLHLAGLVAVIPYSAELLVPQGREEAQNIQGSRPLTPTSIGYFCFYSSFIRVYLNIPFFKNKASLATTTKIN